MIVDLVKRVKWLKEKGDSDPWDRFFNYISNLNYPEASFISNQIKYEWQFFDSFEFENIIKEDDTDYICIKSENREIMVVGKVRFDRVNLVGRKEDPSIFYLWIVTDTFPGLEEIDKRPIQIRLPHYFWCSRDKLNFELKKLFDRLHDTNIEIEELVEYKENKNEIEVWRMKGNHKSDQ